MAKKKTKSKSKSVKKPGRRCDDTKKAWNAPAMVEGHNEHEQQFSTPQGGGFNPLRPEDVGGKANRQYTDARRKAEGIGHGANFGSWSTPNRRLNPRNPQDAKIIKRGMDQIQKEKHSSRAIATIDKRKYDSNYNGINWGNDDKKNNTDKSGVRRPKKRTKKVYK